MAHIGILALQGGFDAHAHILNQLGHRVSKVCQPETLRILDGLILPGGESSSQLHAIHRDGFENPLDEFFRSQKPILATCAGAILVSKHVENPTQPSLGWVDITVSRNAWGSQIDSFEAKADETNQLLVFIRAPRITQCSPSVKVLTRFQGEPVMVQQNHVVAATFHPELAEDCSIYQELFGVTH